MEDPDLRVEHAPVSHENKPDVEPSCGKKVAQTIKGMLLQRRFTELSFLKQGFGCPPEDILAAAIAVRSSFTISVRQGPG